MLFQRLMGWEAKRPALFLRARAKHHVSCAMAIAAGSYEKSGNFASNATKGKTEYGLSTSSYI